MNIKNKLFAQYGKDILDYSKIHKLTGANSIEKIEKDLFINSLNAFKKINIDNKKIIDIGTGAGIPGIPLKIYNPSINLTLLESLGKRIKFLKKVNKYLDFNLLEGRAENLALENKEKFDIATARAFAHIAICLEIFVQYVKVGGYIVLIKGKNAEKEIEKSKEISKKLNLNLEKIIKLKDNLKTHVVIYKKEKSCSNYYPRPYSKIKKESRDL